MNQARNMNGQYTHPLPGSNRGGAIEWQWPAYPYVGHKAFEFIDWMETAITKQVGDDHSPAESNPALEPGQRFVIIVRGKSFTVNVIKAFSLVAGAKTRWRVRLSVDDAAKTESGNLPQIVISYEQWLALNPYQRQIVTVFNGRVGETLRTLMDGRIVVQIGGAPLYWEIYTPTALAALNPPKPQVTLLGYERDPLIDYDMPWLGYPL